MSPSGGVTNGVVGMLRLRNQSSSSLSLSICTSDLFFFFGASGDKFGTGSGESMLEIGLILTEQLPGLFVSTCNALREVHSSMSLD